MNASRRRSSATWLALAIIALIFYASLYPFGPWHVPPNEPWRHGLPLLHYWTAFDAVANFVAYVPLGTMVFVAVVRTGGRARWAWVWSVLGAAALSYGMENLQYFLPRRVPSLLDWGLNSLGGLLGAVLAWVIHRTGALSVWHKWRVRWFVPQSAGALSLLALWPAGLLFPTPAPLAIGQIWPQMREWAQEWVQGSPDSSDLAAWVESWPDTAMNNALPPLADALLTGLGLLAPCLLALAVARPGWHRLVLVLGASALGILVSALSTTLNFGPEHAGSWITPATPVGLSAGLALAMLCCVFPRRANAALGLVVLTAMLVLVSMAPADPYFAQSLQAWEQGQFIQLHGLSKWIGWLWPWVVLVWMLVTVAERGEPLPTMAT